MRAPRLPAPLLLLGSGVSQYVGAGLAVGLFDLMAPPTVAWWRVLVGAVVLLLWRRPWRRRWTGRALAAAAAFGAATALMNAIFYGAISRIALGPAVALEFLGPVAVALMTGRGWRPRVAAGLALGGVLLISGLGLEARDAEQRTGLLLALAAGAAWAAYILLGRRVASEGAGLDSLAIGMAVGAVLLAPVSLGSAAAALGSWGALATVVGVGVLSTVLPYGLEQVALARVQASTFALLTALLPATSLLIGVVMLHQVPHVWEVCGLVLVSVAVALASASDEAEPGPAPHGAAERNG